DHTPEASGARGGSPQAYVLAFIGNADRAEYCTVRTVDQWQGHPVEVWSVNYPGYGGSTGPARLKSIPDSSVAVYDALRQRAGERPRPYSCWRTRTPSCCRNTSSWWWTPTPARNNSSACPGPATTTCPRGNRGPPPGRPWGGSGRRAYLRRRRPARRPGRWHP